MHCRGVLVFGYKAFPWLLEYLPGIFFIFIRIYATKCSRPMLNLQFILNMEAQFFNGFLVPFVVCPLTKTGGYQQVCPLQHR